MHRQWLTAAALLLLTTVVHVEPARQKAASRSIQAGSEQPWQPPWLLAALQAWQHDQQQPTDHHQQQQQHKQRHDTPLPAWTGRRLAATAPPPPPPAAAPPDGVSSFLDKSVVGAFTVYYALIAAGVLLLVITIALTTYCCFCKNRHQGEDEDENELLQPSGLSSTVRMSALSATQQPVPTPTLALVMLPGQSKARLQPFSAAPSQQPQQQPSTRRITPRRMHTGLQQGELAERVNSDERLRRSPLSDVSARPAW